MMRALAFAALFAALLAAGSAGAQTAPPPAAVPTLRSAASVSADVVRIGDLIDNAGSLADTAIFRSPDVGTTGSVSVQQVLDAVLPYHMYLIDTGTITNVEVTRAGRVIDPNDISARIARAFAGRYGLGEAKNLSVTLDGLGQPIMVDAAASGEPVLTNAVLSQFSGRFEAAFDLPGRPGARRSVRLTGTVVEMVSVAVTTRGLPPGTIVRAADITVERRPKSQGLSDAIRSADDAIGLALRTAIRPGHPLRHADLTVPQLVHRDDEFTLVYEVPGILLTTRGKALDSGAQGDVIAVLNVETKRTIQGTVSGPNRVTIRATTTRSSDLAAAALPTSVASR